MFRGNSNRGARGSIKFKVQNWFAQLASSRRRRRQQGPPDTARGPPAISRALPSTLVGQHVLGPIPFRVAPLAAPASGLADSAPAHSQTTASSLGTSSADRQLDGITKETTVAAATSVYSSSGSSVFSTSPPLTRKKPRCGTTAATYFAGSTSRDRRDGDVRNTGDNTEIERLIPFDTGSGGNRGYQHRDRGYRLSKDEFGRANGANSANSNCALKQQQQHDGNTVCSTSYQEGHSQQVQGVYFTNCDFTVPEHSLVDPAEFAFPDCNEQHKENTVVDCKANKAVGRKTKFTVHRPRLITSNYFINTRSTRRSNTPPATVSYVRNKQINEVNIVTPRSKSSALLFEQLFVQSLGALRIPCKQVVGASVAHVDTLVAQLRAHVMQCQQQKHGNSPGAGSSASGDDDGSAKRKRENIRVQSAVPPLFNPQLDALSPTKWVFRTPDKQRLNEQMSSVSRLVKATEDDNIQLAVMHTSKRAKSFYDANNHVRPSLNADGLVHIEQDWSLIVESRLRNDQDEAVASDDNDDDEEHIMGDLFQSGVEKSVDFDGAGPSGWIDTIKKTPSNAIPDVLFESPMQTSFDEVLYESHPINPHLRLIHAAATQRPSKQVTRTSRRPFLDRKSLTFDDSISPRSAAAVGNSSSGSRTYDQMNDSNAANEVGCFDVTPKRSRTFHGRSASLDSLNGDEIDAWQQEFAATTSNRNRDIAVEGPCSNSGSSLLGQRLVFDNNRQHHGMTYHNSPLARPMAMMDNAIDSGELFGAENIPPLETSVDFSALGVNAQSVRANSLNLFDN